MLSFFPSLRVTYGYGNFQRATYSLPSWECLDIFGIGISLPFNVKNLSNTLCANLHYVLYGLHLLLEKKERSLMSHGINLTAKL